MKPSHQCAAYQVSDQMSCPKCGLIWDVNDPEPPQCGKPRTRSHSALITARDKFMSGLEQRNPQVVKGL